MVYISLKKAIIWNPFQIKKKLSIICVQKMLSFPFTSKLNIIFPLKSKIWIYLGWFIWIWFGIKNCILGLLSFMKKLPHKLWSTINLKSWESVIILFFQINQKIKNLTFLQFKIDAKKWWRINQLKSFVSMNTYFTWKKYNFYFWIFI